MEMLTRKTDETQHEYLMRISQLLRDHPRATMKQSENGFFLIENKEPVAYWEYAHTKE